MTIVDPSMRRPVVLALLLSALGAAAPALAGPPAPGWEHRQAERDAAEGRRLLAEGRYDEALFKLQAAYAVEPKVETLFGIAEAQRGGGRTLEAYASYETLSRDRAAELSAAQRQTAESALAELGRKTGTLKLDLADPAAGCTLDGEALAAGTRGAPIRLLIGAHKLVITRPDGTATTYDVIIRRGRETEIPPPAAARPAAVTAPPPPVVTAPPVVPPLPPPVATPPSPPPPVVVPAVRVAPPPPAAPPPGPPPAVVQAPPPAPPVVAQAPPAPPVETLPPLQLTVQPTGPPPSGGEPLPPAPPPRSDDALRVGVMLGILAFPRPVELELAFKVGRWFGIGVQASLLPQLTAPGIDAKMDLRAIQGVFRWYPFGGAFYLGGGLGYQNFQGSYGETVDGGALRIDADMSGPFLVPQMGWMWITDSGFAVGLGLGLQIPIPKEPVVTATYNGQPVPAQPTSSVPQDVIDRANTNSDNVRTLAKLIVRYPFPEIDLLRIGVFF
jgi:hypothetical protein